MHAVSEGHIDPPMCGGCRSVLLWYIDTTGDPYWRCTGCGRVSIPGTLALREMQMVVERTNDG